MKRMTDARIDQRGRTGAEEQVGMVARAGHRARVTRFEL
jgi:hypothetical protein